jgi:hypothetical protein
VNLYPYLRRLLAVIVYLSLIAAPTSGARTVKAIFVGPSEDVPEKAVLVVVGKYLDIDLPQRNLSAAIEIPGGDLAVGVLPAKPAQPDIPAGMPTFQIPESWTQCILLFFHDPSNKVFPARILPVNSSAANFPLGHTVIFNASSAGVIAKFGGETVQVAPGKSATVKPPRSDSGDYPIAIDCIQPGEKQPVALCRSTWQHDADARQILFVTPMPGRKIPRIWGVLERQIEGTKN